MPNCPVCGEPHPRTLAAFDCDGCGVELKMSVATSAAMVLAAVPLVIALLLLKPWIGRGGVIVFGIIGSQNLPWVAFYLFFSLEPTGTSFNLGGPDKK